MPETQPSTKADQGDDDHGDIYKASTVASIRATLAQLKKREATVTSQLDHLVSSQAEFSRTLGRLDLLRAHLGSQVVTTRGLRNGPLGSAASTATRISSAVKRLDLEQSRVKATLEVVEQVSELKACVLGVTGSMGAPQDWEKAAGYLSRASKIPRQIIDGAFAAQMVPTAEVPDGPSVTLETAAESLCGLFLREFDKAAKQGDGAKVTRFFKLFPLIGRAEVGLDAYGRYVCQGVAARARANLHNAQQTTTDGIFYAQALSKLFEHVAQIVEGHGQLVERHYGQGSMVRVIERLQVEADLQGGIIIDTWSDERNIMRRLADIKSYAFSFLVQSFLSQQKPGGGGGATPGGSNAAATRDTNVGRTGDEEDGTDMKEIDGLLGEAAIMLGRWSLYCRFLARKCQNSTTKTTEANDNREADQLSIPSFLADSNLSKKVADRLISPFTTMTTFFFRRSVEKAFQLDEPPSDLSLDLHRPIPSNPPYITSAVDDVMYIVNAVLQRSLATSQLTVVTGVVPTLGRVLGSDFVGMVQRKMRDESYPKAAVQGGAPPEDKVVAFLVLINNLDLATDYIRRIIQSRVHSTNPASNLTTNNEEDHQQHQQRATPLVDLFPFGLDAVAVSASLNAMQLSFESKTTELLNDAVAVVFDRVIKPRLRPILADSFRDTDYQLSEAELLQQQQTTTDGGGATHDGEADRQYSPVKARFSQLWTSLMRPLARLLTERNHDRLLSVTVGYFSAKVLEKRIWGYHGRVNELGAVRLERDIAGIVVAVVKGGKYALRDAFARCTQICMVMTMEKDEWEDLVLVERDGKGLGGEGTGDGDRGEMEWRINREERRRARGMVVGDG
ncbi:MAG: hypothetical protein M1816_006403 [Peltula sp. TS41687]|nr:MAG: hypothetical protein M1816_006403 [Peltula sp. TS41687]